MIHLDSHLNNVAYHIYENIIIVTDEQFILIVVFKLNKLYGQNLI